MGVVPAGRPGHVPGHAEAALHEGAGAHRQILRGVPAGAAVGGGGSQAAAAVVRPAAQQELLREHVTGRRAATPLRFPQSGNGGGVPPEMMIDS